MLLSLRPSRALRLFLMGRALEGWDPAKHPRIPKGLPDGGQFLTLDERMQVALHGGGDLNGFSRPSLLRAAKDRGIYVRRGASEEELRSALEKDIKAKGVSEKAKQLSDAMGARDTIDAASKSDKLDKLGPKRATVAGHEQAQADIREIVRGVLQGRGDRNSEWVSLADVREELGRRGYSRADQDAALRALEQQPDVNIVPQANEKALSDRTRQAAINIGLQDKHFITIIPHVGAVSDPEQLKMRRDDLHQQIGVLRERADKAYARVVARYGDNGNRWPSSDDNVQNYRQSRDEMQAKIKQLRQVQDELTSSATPKKAAKAIPLTPEGKADLQKMTVPQLRAFAKANDVPRAEHAKTKADLIYAIGVDDARGGMHKLPEVHTSAKAAPKKDAAEIASRVNASSTSDEVLTHLDGLTAAQLHDVAREMNMTSTKGLTKDEIRRRIAQSSAGVSASYSDELRSKAPKLQLPGHEPGDNAEHARARLQQSVKEIEAEARARDEGLQRQLRDAMKRQKRATSHGPKEAARRLDAAKTREEAHAALDGMTVAQLRDVADELKFPGAKSKSKADLKNHLVEFTVGNRLNFQAHIEGAKHDEVGDIERRIAKLDAQIAARRARNLAPTANQRALRVALEGERGRAPKA